MKKERIFLIVLVACSFLARLLWIMHVDNSVDHWGDWWDELAFNLVSGKGYQVVNPFNAADIPYYSWRGPAFPSFLAAVYFIFGHSFLAAKIFMAVIGSFSGVLGYFVAKRMFNIKAAVLAGIGISFYPTFIFLNGYLAPETLTIFLILFFMFFLTRDLEKPSYLNYVFGGVFLGCAILCRTILSVFPIFVLIWMLLVYKNKKEALKKIILLALLASVVVSPWVIRNYKIHHSFVLNSTDGGQAFYINNNPQSFMQDESGVSYYYDDKEFKGMSEMQVTRILYKRANDFIKNNPAVFLKYVGKRFVNFWRVLPHSYSGVGKSYSRLQQIASAAYTIPLFVFAIVGFIFSVKDWRKMSILYFLILYYSTMYIIVRGIIRYRMPIESYIIIFASYGIWSLYAVFKKNTGKKQEN